MILRHYLHTDPAVAVSYLVGCGGHAAGAVVDPVAEPAFYLSVCGRGLSGNPVSSIGYERRFNAAFALTDDEALVELMVRDVPPRPPRAAEIRAINAGAGVELAAEHTSSILTATA